MRGLAASRHAPSNGFKPVQQSTSITPAPGPSELSRFKKIIRRLQWKSQFLDAGYRIAVDRVSKDLRDAADHEMMFKLDFFEYYMLIERALVHLLGVFGLSISSSNSSVSPTTIKGGKGSGGGGLGGSRWKQSRGHRYHANVLEALDLESNPLHEVLGKGEVRRQLGKAKDLRNRWKGVDGSGERNGDGKREEERWLGTKKVPAPLESYGLAKMLKVISDGFGEGYAVAERYVAEGTAAGREDMDVEDDGRVIDWSEEVESMERGALMDVEEEEEGWEFMVDAMDWEAV
ncbi:hypothetical protein QBC44DRAFT_343094 [Cladorrhinum sp. PSN332]|nr:hypothetical protein QBC44DRAFT_343094 [Cladorrhinum sp. PSN332]